MKNKDYSGLAMLKGEPQEEKIQRLERELQLEKRGRNNDLTFYENEYKTLSMAYLELCDDGYCKGDFSVGDIPCQYWDDINCLCRLKRVVGHD